MKKEEFIEELSKARELMNKQQYSTALKILKKLKNIEKHIKQDFNYDLIHQLYQLDSNCQSELNQEKILRFFKEISNNKKSIPFNELNLRLRENGILNLNEELLRREIELLILKNRLNCKIDKDTIIM